MPIASSSAMCLSRVTGSRPVQPAITAGSIGNVSGVVVSWASMVKVRSNTDNVLHCGREFEDAAVRSACCRNHQPDWYLALAMAGQRNRAAVDHVDQRTIAQRQQVGFRESLVVGQVGDARRRIGGGREDQRGLGREADRGARDQRLPRLEQIDVVGGAYAFTAENAQGHAGVIDVALAYA